MQNWGHPELFSRIKMKHAPFWHVKVTRALFRHKKFLEIFWDSFTLQFLTIPHRSSKTPQAQGNGQTPRAYRTGKVLPSPKMYVLLNHTKNTVNLNENFVTFGIPVGNAIPTPKIYVLLTHKAKY
jgi:hypothetical protein